MESATIGRLRNGMKVEGDALFSGGNDEDFRQPREQHKRAKKSVGAKNSLPKEFTQEDIVLYNGLPTACVSTSAGEERSTGRTDDDEQTAI